MEKPDGAGLAGWRGHSADVEFDDSDFEVVDLALNLIPELRICALAVKRARSAGVRYPGLEG